MSPCDPLIPAKAGTQAFFTAFVRRLRGSWSPTSSQKIWVPAFAGIIGIISCCLVLQGCAQKKPSRAACPPGKVCLQIGNVFELDTLDPNKAAGVWEDRVVQDTFMGLTQDDPEGNPIPGAAERWETSADGLTWRFYLRDMVWSDGVPVTADDFVFGMRRLLLPSTAAQYASLIYVIKGAEAVNAGTAPPETLGVIAIAPKVLEIRLEHPAPYLLQLAKHETMLPLPRHVVEKWGDAWAQPGHLVGNGAFTPVAWKLGDYLRSVKNPRFYEAEKVCADEMYYYPTTDTISAQRQVKRGELDVNGDINSNRIAFLRKDMPGYVRTHVWLDVTYLAFNLHVPALKDVRVRRALSMAIDREFITDKLLRGGQLPAYAFVPPGVANYPSVKGPYWSAWPFEKRQAEARRLLSSAGYGPARPLKIEIKHRNSADPMLVMPSIQADWKAVGVETTLAVNEGQIAYAAYRARDFQVADAGWVADFNDPESFLYLLQSATGAQNYGDYKSQAFDALIAKADQQADLSVRAKIFAQAEQIMLDDAPVATTFFQVNKNLVNPRVTGWVDNIVDIHRGRYLCVRGANAPAGR